MQGIRPITLLLTMSLSGTLQAATLDSGSLADFGWKEKSFNGKSEYSLANFDGTRAIRGHTDSAASALYRNLKTDLRKTPYLNWQWQIENTFDNPNEREKQGDDFPARVYVVYQKARKASSFRAEMNSADGNAVLSVRDFFLYYSCSKGLRSDRPDVKPVERL